jgi:hypothetical protein
MSDLVNLPPPANHCRADILKDAGYSQGVFGSVIGTGFVLEAIEELF